MTAEVVNLRLHRKRKAREDSARVAEANRRKFGRTAAERKLTKAQSALQEDRLDGLKIVRDDPPRD